MTRPDVTRKLYRKHSLISLFRQGTVTTRLHRDNQRATEAPPQRCLYFNHVFCFRDAEQIPPSVGLTNSLPALFDQEHVAGCEHLTAKSMSLL